MDISHFACPSCKEKNSIQSVPAIVASSSSSGSFTGLSGGLVNIDGEIGYTTSHINLKGELTSNLARQLSAPVKPEIYKATFEGIILGTIFFILIGPSIFFTAYNYFKKKKKSKERFEYLYPKWPQAFDKWKSSFYCHKCGIVFNPCTGEHCFPNQIEEFLDYKY